MIMKIVFPNTHTGTRTLTNVIYQNYDSKVNGTFIDKSSHSPIDLRSPFKVPRNSNLDLEMHMKEITDKLLQVIMHNLK